MAAESYEALMSSSHMMTAAAHEYAAAAAAIDPCLDPASRIEARNHYAQLAASYRRMARLFDTLSQPAQEATP